MHAAHASVRILTHPLHFLAWSMDGVSLVITFGHVNQKFYSKFLHTTQDAVPFTNISITIFITTNDHANRPLWSLSLSSILALFSAPARDDCESNDNCAFSSVIICINSFVFMNLFSNHLFKAVSWLFFLWNIFFDRLTLSHFLLFSLRIVFICFLCA